MNEDAKISRAGLYLNFQEIIDSARAMLAHREFQLKESQDFQGNSHTAWVTAVAKSLRQHLRAAEKTMKEQS